MKIHGFNKTTLLDYPEHLASTIFLGGCNYRCPFCHNASLVLNPNGQPIILEEDIFKVLNKRKNFLEGVCITGGEPTIYSDLPVFISKIKELKLKVKLDTNGSSPYMIKLLLRENLIDYIAMDIKSSLPDYPLATGLSNCNIENIKESVNIIMSSNISYEFRTTVVKELHSFSNFGAIGEWLKGANAYYLQAYKDSGDILKAGFSACSKQEMEQYQLILKEYIPHTFLRGID